jgi:uncharacterized membrane protein
MLTRTESLIKAITYRLFTSAITFVVALVLTGKLDFAGLFTLVDLILRTLSYYAHERLFFWWRNRRADQYLKEFGPEAIRKSKSVDTSIVDLRVKSDLL